MLIICNGAIKSGSTWLYNILARLVPVQSPPERFLTLRNPKHPCIRPELLGEFLASVDVAGSHYLSKNHLNRTDQRRLLIDNPHVFVFDIERDPRDVVVSNYYHDAFRNGYQGSFAQYYWGHGREVAASLSAYHKLWRDFGRRGYVASYERLHGDFASEVSRIAAVLGLQLTPQRCVELRHETSLKRLRQDYATEARFEGEKFFRKGEIGDWRNHFDARMLADIESIERRGIGRFDLPRWRQRLRGLLGAAGRPPDISSDAN